ncbi:MAG: cell division protein FtsZ [Rubrivivax sp.]|nr:cell division protein FtsZ [Rubrivivax sp.]
MTLTTALVILGVVVLAALAVQSWWAMRRDRPREPGEAAEGPARVEPSLHDTEPGLADEPPALRATGKLTPRLDALIDAIAPLALDGPITGELVLQHLPSSRRAGTKPFYVEGLDAETGEWEAIAAGRRYSELQAGVQLANRSGPLNAIEYSEFVQKLQAFADAVGATPDVPDMLDVVARARELDTLSAPLDAQLSVTLRTNGVAWSVGFVQQVAGRLGLVPGVLPGRLVLPSKEEGAPPMLVLAVDPQAALADDPQAAVVRECTLTLDVPQTPASQEPFPAWHLTGRQLADDLDATAVDDQGQAITLHAYDAIGKELDELYQRLEQLDLAAGTPAARRLFS